jgi:hypothetical protein
MDGLAADNPLRMLTMCQLSRLGPDTNILDSRCYSPLVHINSTTDGLFRSRSRCPLPVFPRQEDNTLSGRPCVQKAEQRPSSSRSQVHSMHRSVGKYSHGSGGDSVQRASWVLKCGHSYFSAVGAAECIHRLTLILSLVSRTLWLSARLRSLLILEQPQGSIHCPDRHGWR